MSAKVLFAILFFYTMVVVSHPARQNVPITDGEWAKLNENGLGKRSAAKQNVPITEGEWANLNANGLGKRDLPILARDEVRSCGLNITGGRVGGNHVGWVPIDSFYAAARQFCIAYSGSEVAFRHETSESYGVSLTNQDEPEKTGPSGNIVFAVYNTKRATAYNIDHKSCYEAMVAPLEAHIGKEHIGDNGEPDGYGDRCYGGKNKDYEGGYQSVDGVGAFGSEVSKPPPNNEGN